MGLDSGLDDILYHRLLNLQDLDVITPDADSSALNSLITGLAEVQLIAKRGISEGLLSTRTLNLARSISSLGKVLANHFLSVERINYEVGGKREAELQDAMGRMSLDDRTPSPSTSSTTTRRATPSRASQAIIKAVRSSTTRPLTKDRVSSHSSSSSTAVSEPDEEVLPLHVAKSYDWLLKHLHNPYPSHTVKSRIAEETGASTKTVNDWFVQIRRRIGWTAIVKRHFRKCRAEAVDCATNLLYGQPDEKQIPQHISDAFIAMKTCAERLFEGKIGTSEAVDLLDTIAEMQQDKKRHMWNKEKSLPDNAIRQRNNQVSEIADSPADLRSAVDSCRPTFKRKRYNDELSTSLYDDFSNRGLKRHRSLSSDYTEVDISDSSSTYDSSTSSLEAITPPPNSTSLDSWLASIPHNIPPCVVSPPVYTRKRRLSLSSDAAPEPERQKLRIAELEYPAIEDNLSCTSEPACSMSNVNSLDQLWPELDFTMPTGALLDQPISNGALQVDLFDWTGWISAAESVTGAPAYNILEYSHPEPQLTVVTPSAQSHSTFDVSSEHTGLEQLEPLDMESLSSLPVIAPLLHVDGDQPFFGCGLGVPDNTLESDTLLSSIWQDINSLSSEQWIPNQFSDSTTVSRTINADVVPETVYQDNVSSLISDLERTAKLERLKQLREERNRLAEQEKELELSLNV